MVLLLVLAFRESELTSDLGLVTLELALIWLNSGKRVAYGSVKRECCTKSSDPFMAPLNALMLWE